MSFGKDRMFLLRYFNSEVYCFFFIVLYCFFLVLWGNIIYYFGGLLFVFIGVLFEFLVRLLSELFYFKSCF